MEPKTTISVLHVEDSADDAEIVIRELRKSFDVNHRIVASEPELTRALSTKWDVVLSDFSMPGFTGLEALHIIRKLAPELPFIFVSGTIGEERAVDAIKAGASDYVIKNSLRRLIPVVERILRDVAAKEKLKESEENLAKMRARYQLFAENATDIIAILDDQAIVQYISPALTLATGYTPEEVVGTNGLQMVSTEYLGRIGELLRCAIDRNESFQEAFSVRHKNGQIVWLEISGRRIMNPVTGRIEVLTVTRDVTGRYAAEARNRELAMMLDVAHDSVQVRDLKHRILFWNKGAEKIYGWNFTEIRGKAVRDLLYADTAEFDRAQLLLIKNGEFRGKLKQIRRNGESLVVNASWTLINDEKGSPKSILCIHSDITEATELEEIFLRAQRLESIGTLASGIAHDLNNALTPVLLASAVLHNELQTPDHKEMVDTIRISASRGADMVKQILAFARGAEKNETKIDMRSVLADIEKIVRDTFPKNINLTVKIAGPLWPIRADVTQIHQVLMNLIVNARDAMEDGGGLLVSAENCKFDEQYAVMSGGVETGEYLLVRVADSGTGMSPELLKRIFDPFFTTKEPGKGTGLGLSTALRIVQGQGGFLRVESEPGKGTQFHMYLPALLAEEKNQEKQQPFDRFLGGSGECVLVVDDDKQVRSITAKTLSRNGYTVLEAGDGAEATVIFGARKQDIGLILTDVMMPVLDGVGLIHVIRKINPVLPIVVTSGLEGSKKLKFLEGDEHIRFIAKPYHAEMLLNVVGLALHR